MTYCEWDIDDVDISSVERFKCALTINKETGRVQWCAGSKFIKMLIILPATLLPVVLVLLLVNHFDLVGSVQPQKNSAVFLSSEQQNQNFAALSNSLDSNDDNNQAEDFDAAARSSAATNKQCMAIRYSMSESVDNEDRDLLKDVRTSFIPPDSVFVPPNCQSDDWSSMVDTNNHNNNRDEIIEEAISFRQALRDYEHLFPSYLYRQRRKRAEVTTVAPMTTTTTTTISENVTSSNEASAEKVMQKEEEEKSKEDDDDEEVMILSPAVDEVNIPASVHAFWKGQGMCDHDTHELCVS